MDQSVTPPANGLTAAPTAAKPSLIFRPDNFFERLNLAELFPVTQPLEVELGCGDGSFMAQYARLHPEHNFLGVERLLGRLRKLNKKGLRAGLKNLRIIRIEASYFIEYMVPSASTTALHIYFPDPWPKRKQRKNRLINERFTEIARQVLVMNGIVYLRTDDKDYFEQMTTVFAANAHFEAMETPAELSVIITDFERQFNAQGIPTNRAAYRKKD